MTARTPAAGRSRSSIPGPALADRREADPAAAGSLTSAILLDGVHLSYGSTPALRGADLSIAPGDHVAVMGPSGCGKSTLLHLVAGVLKPDQGRTLVLGTDLATLTPAQQARFRLERTGMVFQFGDLIGELTLRENVALPLSLLRLPRAESTERVSAILRRLGIDHVADRRPAEVSGGQAQRAAVARALVHEPALLLADEPTGSLDSAAGDEVMEALVEQAREVGATLLVVTHDHRAAAHLDRLVTMRDGRVVS